MAKAVIMPKFSMTQETGTIITWLKEAGETVEKGDPIAEVETDKVNMEVEAPADGILAGLRYGPGDVVPVTEVIAYILAEGEALPEGEPPPAQPEAAPPTSAQGAPVSASPLAQRIAAAEGVDLADVPGTGPGGRVTRSDVERYLEAGERPADGRGDHGRVRATPAARRIARESGVELAAVSGSGPRGRVQAADVAQQAAQVPPPDRLAPPPEAPAPEIIPLQGMRRTIAERMQASYQQAPHILFTRKIDMSAAIAFREFANQRTPEGDPTVSMTALIVQAVAWTLRQHPAVNAWFRHDQIERVPEVHIGVAVALEEELIVPVVHHADRKGLHQIGADVAGLAERARAGQLRPDDVTGGTFTVSNLGMFGIDHFTAIINPPQVAILAVGRIAKRFVPDENDQPVVRPLMTVTLAVDHRALDGAMAARFVTTLREALENPATLLL